MVRRTLFPSAVTTVTVMLTEAAVFIIHPSPESWIPGSLFKEPLLLVRG